MGGEDSELVRRARLGDKRAFEDLIERYGPAVYRFGLRMLRDEGLTEDCVQETFIAAWTSIDRFRGESSVKTWLLAIMANQVRRQVRRFARHPEVHLPEDHLGPTADQPASQAQRRHLLADLERALAQLPTPQRACWLLREVEGLSYAEIAQVQMTTVTSVRGSIHRARESLAKMLEGWR